MAQGVGGCAGRLVAGGCDCTPDKLDSGQPWSTLFSASSPPAPKKLPRRAGRHGQHQCTPHLESEPLFGSDVCLFVPPSCTHAAAPRGCRGELVDINTQRFQALVRIKREGGERQEVWLEYEDISKLEG